MNQLLIKKIKKHETKDLKRFISNCGKSKETFSYFEKRNLKVLENHVLTLLLFKNNEPVGYGHLDKEKETIWLGICIIEKELKKGYGKIIMKELLSFADKNKINLNLSVFKTNIAAYKLYQKFGFKIVKKDENNIYMFRMCSN